MTKFQIHINVELRDKNGKLIKKTKKKLSNSYVQQFIDIIQICMSYVAGTVTDTGGVARAYNTAAPNLAQPHLNVVGGVGVVLYGIIVGIGTDAVTISDFKLQSPIAHGNNPTQLSYGSTSVGALATVDTTRQFTVARTFTNNSGSDITVQEVGLYCWFRDVPNADRYAMLERTLLEFVIANGTSGTVTYTISVTV